MWWFGLMAGAQPAPEALEPTCTAEPSKKRTRQMASLVRAEDREGKGRLIANHYRLDLARQTIERGEICTPTDALQVAFFLARSPLRSEHVLATRYLRWAHQQGLVEAGPLAAAAWDTYLTSAGKPQWYGAKGAEDCLYPIDPAATDEQRRALGARTLDEVVRDTFILNDLDPIPGATLQTLEKRKMICASARWAAVPTYSAEDIYDTVNWFGGRFNHDGSKLLIGSNQTGVVNVYSQPVDGGSATALTHSTTDGRIPVAWFPEDDRFLYTSDVGGNERQHLFVQELDGNTTDLTPGAAVRASFYGWASDHNSFFIATNQRDEKAMDLYRVSIEPGFPQERIYENADARTVGDISGDGRWVVIDEVKSNIDSDLYLIDLQASGAEPLLLTPGDAPSPHVIFGFEPDGAGLWYGSNEQGEFMVGMRYDLERQVHEVRIEEPWDVKAVGFSEHGRYRYHLTNVDAQRQVSLWDTLENQAVPMPSGLPDAAIQSVRFASDERQMAFWAAPDTEPQALYTATIGDAAVRIESPPSKVDPEDLATSEVIRFKSFDGLEIPGILTLPLNADADDPAPGVVFVHGGPGGQSTRGYRADIQFLVNRGYAVLAVNNRGSSGYGKTFYHADDRRHGDLDLKDCLAARDALGALPGVDADRIGIMGGSYGGYLVLAALSFEPTSFRAGVDIFGISNWIRTLESIPPWWESFKTYLYAEIGDPVADRERLQAFSPLLHADQIERPLLVVQGKNDPRVIEVESAEIVAAVRENGETAEYLLFEDEGHGFRKTSNRVEAAETWLRFFDEHLAKPVTTTPEPERTPKKTRRGRERR